MDEDLQRITILVIMSFLFGICVGVGATLVVCG